MSINLNATNLIVFPSKESYSLNMKTSEEIFE